MRVARRRGAGALLAILLGLGALLTRGAGAAPAAQRIAVLRAADDDGAAHQAATLLMAELKAAGFEAIEVDRDPRAPVGADLAAAWSRLQPVAVLVIVPGRGAAAAVAAVDLWVEDGLTGQRSARTIEVAAGAGGGGAGGATDLALKAVEILRGSLLEVTVARAAAPPVAPPVDLARSAASAPSSPPRFFGEGFGLSAGAGALGATGVGASVAPMLRLGWGSAHGYLVRLAASGLGSAPEVRAVEGVARVRQALIEVEGLRAFRAGSRWQPLLGVGAGAYRVGADGTGVSALFPSRAGSSTAAALSAQLGFALRLGARFALVTDAGLLWLSPATKIKIADREAARVGGVSALATLSLFARL